MLTINFSIKNHFDLFVLSVNNNVLHVLIIPMQELLQQEVSDSPHIYIITVACIAHDETPR